MGFADAIMIAGLCLIVGAGAFLLWTGLSAARRANGQDLRLMNDHPGARLDLFMGIVWTGMFLVQVSNLLLHIQPGGMYRLSPLSLMATAGTLFVCGVLAGRLLLRREIRWYKENREEHTREART